MQHTVLQQLVSHGIHQRLQLHAAGAHPLSECGARDGETSAAEDRFLAVQMAWSSRLFEFTASSNRVPQ